MFKKHNDTIYELDKITSANEFANGVSTIRKLIVGFAEGNVLETCIGVSNNLRFYNNDKVKKITGIDYSPNAIELAISKDVRNLDIDYLLEDAEKFHYKAHIQ